MQKATDSRTRGRHSALTQPKHAPTVTNKCQTSVAKDAVNQPVATSTEPTSSVVLVPKNRFDHAVTGETLYISMIR